MPIAAKSPFLKCLDIFLHFLKIFRDKLKGFPNFKFNLLQSCCLWRVHLSAYLRLPLPLVLIRWFFGVFGRHMFKTSRQVSSCISSWTETLCEEAEEEPFMPLLMAFSGRERLPADRILAGDTPIICSAWKLSNCLIGIKGSKIPWILTVFILTLQSPLTLYVYTYALYPILCTFTL